MERQEQSAQSSVPFGSEIMSLWRTASRRADSLRPGACSRPCAESGVDSPTATSHLVCQAPACRIPCGAGALSTAAGTNGSNGQAAGSRRAPLGFQLRFAPASMRYILGNGNRDAMYCIARTRLVSRMYSLRIRARSAAFLLLLDHTTVLRWLRNTERNKQMRTAPKIGTIRDCLRSVVQNDP